MSMHASNDVSLRSSLRPWRFLFAGFGVVLLVVLFYAEENWRGKRAWDNYCRSLASRGESVRIADIMPPRVPDDQNFTMSPFLSQFMQVNGQPSFKLFETASSIVGSAKDQASTIRSNSWFTAPTDLRAWAEAFRVAESNKVQTVSAPATELDAARVVLGKLSIYDPVLDEVREASKRPSARWNVDYSAENPAAILLPHLARIKGLCQFLQLRASAELAAGQTDAALADVDLGFRVADSLRGESFLISHLVRIACANIALKTVADGLAQHQWSDAQLSALEKRLAEFDFCSSAHRALQGERAFGPAVIEYLRKNPGQFSSLAGLGGPGGSQSFDAQGALLAAVPSGWFYLEELNECKLIDSDLLSALDLERKRFLPEQCATAEKHIESIVSGSKIGMVLHHRVFVGMLLPALTKVVLRSALTQASIDCAAVAAGLERYRLANGRYPETLAGLDPKFIAKMPADPISGEPLKYRPAADGSYVLYSVGWNGVDDGGILATNKSGKGVENTQGDWVWKLSTREPER